VNIDRSWNVTVAVIAVTIIIIIIIMGHTRIPLQAYKYQPYGKRDVDGPRRRWRQ
jgi:hypothetical protein